jgi:hypothetical protein
VYLVRTQSQIVRSCGRSALKIKKSQIKSNKVKINQINAILANLPGISLFFCCGDAAPVGFTIKPITPISPWSAPKNHTPAICLFMFIYAKFMQTLRF